MRERMSAKRLEAIIREHVKDRQKSPELRNAHGDRAELIIALKAERKTIESLPCYLSWFWNDGEPDPFPDCDCPVCEMKAKRDGGIRK